jgi:hypothetical protein
MDKKIFEKLIFFASKAPSGDNQQPWRIQVKSPNFERIELFTKKPTDNFLYFKNRANFIACGCFLKNLEIAAQHFGYKTTIILALSD